MSTIRLDQMKNVVGDVELAGGEVPRIRGLQDRLPCGIREKLQRKFALA